MRVPCAKIPQQGQRSRASLISARGLSKTYASERSGAITALEAVNFDIAEGEFVSLVGPSGCGKSTLLRLIAELVTPTSGVLSLAMGRFVVRVLLRGRVPVARAVPWRTSWRTLGSVGFAGGRPRFSARPWSS